MTERNKVLDYWRNFFSDLFLGTFVRLFLFGGGGFLIGIASTMYFDSTQLSPSGWSSWLQWLVLIPSTIWFGIMGVSHGLIASAISIASKKLSEMVLGLHDLLDLLVKGTLASFPNLDRHIPKKELEDRFEKLGHKFLEELQLKGGPVNALKGLIFKMVLKALKFFFIDDVMEEIRKKGTDQVSRSDIESAIRRVGLELVLSPITDNLILLQIGNGLLLVFTLGLPYFIFWII